MMNLQDTQVERELVAQLLVAPFELRTVLVDERLTGEHLTDISSRCIFEALVAIRDRGEHPTDTLVVAELGRDPRAHEPQNMLDQAQGWLYGTDTRALCRELKDLHRRRQMRAAAALISDAAVAENPADAMAEAERLLTQPEASAQTTWSAEENRDWFFDQFKQGGIKAFPYEFSKLNEWTGGGVRPGEYVLVGGWSSHGKSVWLDSVLEHFAAQDLKTHLYINEHTRAARLERTIARLSGVPFRRVHSRKLIDDDDKKILAAMDELKVGMTDCAGWTAGEIARHIRWNKWDVCGVDILHNIEHDDERGMAHISGAMRAVSLQTGTAVFAAVHLNDARAIGAKHPAPVPRDIRMSGMLYRQADTCFFVHRDEDDDGLPGNTGLLLATKIRDGQPSAMKILFDSGRMRFEPAAPGGIEPIRASRRVDPDARTQSQPVVVGEFEAGF